MLNGEADEYTTPPLLCARLLAKVLLMILIATEPPLNMTNTPPFVALFSRKELLEILNEEADSTQHHHHNLQDC